MLIEERIENALKTGARSIETAAQMAFTVRDHARRILKNMHTAGKIHVVGWTRQARGPYTPVYTWGPGRDAKKPEQMSDSERSRRYRQSLRRKFGEHYGKIHAAQKQRVPGRQVVIEGQVVYQQ